MPSELHLKRRGYDVESFFVLIPVPPQPFPTRRTRRATAVARSHAAQGACKGEGGGVTDRSTPLGKAAYLTEEGGPTAGGPPGTGDRGGVGRLFLSLGLAQRPRRLAETSLDGPPSPLRPSHTARGLMSLVKAGGLVSEESPPPALRRPGPPAGQGGRAKGGFGGGVLLSPGPLV